MAFEKYFFVALFCSAYANPLGQTTVCESSSNLLPGFAPTTVCESTSYHPYLPFYPYSYQQVIDASPNLVPYGYLPGYPLPLGPVAESPNVVSVVQYPNVPVSGVGSTTVCESTSNVHPSPNLVSIFPYPNHSVPNLGSTTVCESAPVVPLSGLPYPYIPGLGVGPLGVPFL